MAKTKTAQIPESAQTGPPQTAVDIMQGVSVRRTAGGIPVVRLHYSAHPERNPDQHPEWKAQERRTYTSQSDWDREQEIIDEAGGGELVFAGTLITYWNKIVITDPAWRPDPEWSVIRGFDHGKTNPTALERAYVDYAGVIYILRSVRRALLVLDGGASHCKRGEVVTFDMVNSPSCHRGFL